MSSVRPRGLDLHFPKPPKRARVARAIKVLPTEITTPSIEVPVADTPRLARLAVVCRHGGGGGTAYGLAEGTGLVRGAVAQTIAHDSHNIIVVGANDADMRLAARRLAEIGGGVAVALSGSIVGEFPMPYGGLMTDLPPRAVRAERALLGAIRRTGMDLPSPVTTLAFLSLPVIPELKITDLGLVDVTRERFVDLYA
jgi:adenine deaminase